MRIILTAISVTLFCIAALLGFSCSVTDHSTKTVSLDVVKSPTDQREYRYLVLANQLEVLLISDVSTDQASASLCVFVGQKNDPENEQGLAHFLEHTLFLGTDKYPDADELGNFLSSHGGMSNAYTSYETTNYFFSVHKDYLEGALDRFSRFFIAPRFDERLIQREINAVHSEHQKNVKNDGRRLYRIIRSTANPDHPYHKFGTGNIQSLNGNQNDVMELRKRLIKYYTRHYSSNVMKLVILGRESLDELEKMAKSYFSPVRNNSVKPISYAGIPIIKEPLPRKILVQPVKTIRRLRLMFPIPSLRKYYKSKPGSIVSQLLGDEGEGSVLAYLKNRGWATSLSAGSGHWSNDFAFFGIDINLTRKGLTKTDEIIRTVFQYIELIKKQPSVERYFEEVKRIAEIEFQFKEKEIPMEYVMYLSSNLWKVEPGDVVVSRWLYEKYRQDLIENLLRRLTVNNLQVVLVAPGVQVNRVEKWYKIKYKVERVDASTTKIWSSSLGNEHLHLPGDNPFIPKKVELTPVANVRRAPVIISDTGFTRLWFKRDGRFKVPKGNIRISLSTPQAYSSAKNAAYTRLFVTLLRERLNQYAYPASLAGLRYSLSNSVKGVSLSLSGYSENTPLFFQKIINTMKGFKVNPERFEIFRNQMREKRRNQKLSQAFKRVAYESYYLLSRELWHTDEYLGVMDELTATGLETFVGLLLSHARIEVLVHGNFTRKEAKRFAKSLEMAFVDRDRKPLSPIIERTTKIPLAKPVTYQFRVEDVNSAIQVVYEAGPKRIRQSVALDMIQQIMEKPFYHQLRTVEQLGYLVWSGFNRMNNVDGFYFVIQSNSKDPVYLQGRIERFVSHFEKTLSAISSEEFETFKNALIARREEQPKTLNEETGRYWSVILDQEYDFQFRDAEIKELRRLTLSDVLEVYRKVFTTPSTGRKLVVQAVGKHHISVRPKGVLIRDPADFKRRASYFNNPLGKPVG